MADFKKPKLELTWIGKDKQPQLEPRILIEDTGKSYGDRTAARACAGVWQTENRRQDCRIDLYDKMVALLIIPQKHLAVVGRISYTLINTRAVPLVRKDDAHQGRVFYFRKACTCEGGTL